MLRKILGYIGLADFFAHRQRHGIAELQMGKGFTPEEEDREVMAFFKEVANDFGYPHIHTLKVVPEDGRELYFVHVDNVEGNKNTGLSNLKLQSTNR